MGCRLNSNIIWRYWVSRSWMSPAIRALHHLNPLFWYISPSWPWWWGSEMIWSHSYTHTSHTSHVREYWTIPGRHFSVIRQSLLEENFGLQRPLWLICKDCYMKTLDISKIYPQQAHQADDFRLWNFVNISYHRYCDNRGPWQNRKII